MRKSLKEQLAEIAKGQIENAPSMVPMYEGEKTEKAEEGARDGEKQKKTTGFVCGPVVKPHR